MRSDDYDDYLKISGLVVRHALGALAVAGASWLAILLVGSPAVVFAMAPFGLAVALAVWVGGRGPGLTAAILSLAASDFFIIEPGSLFTLQSRGADVRMGRPRCRLAGFLPACRSHPPAGRARARPLYRSGTSRCQSRAPGAVDRGARAGAHILRRDRCRAAGTASRASRRCRVVLHGRAGGRNNRGRQGHRVPRSPTRGRHHEDRRSAQSGVRRDPLRRAHPHRHARGVYP